VRRAALALLAMLIALPAAAQDAGSPHHMTTPDGSLDMATCGVCHNEDMSLQRSKLETCTLCHPASSHAGSAEHLRLAPDVVKRGSGSTANGERSLPLAEDGRIYCGTCHLFHDPKVLSEDWLAQGWLPPQSGLPEAVRQAVRERWATLMQREGATGAGAAFASKGTRQLRLPVDGGQLCLRCHGGVQ
jgi:hypothetical protein